MIRFLIKYGVYRNSFFIRVHDKKPHRNGASQFTHCFTKDS